MKPSIIVIGETQTATPTLVPIKLVNWIVGNGAIMRCSESIAARYNYIELISKNYGTFDSGEFIGKQFDLIFCYDDPNDRSSGCLHYGFWNDGVV